MLKNWYKTLPGVFLIVRIIMLLSLPLEGIIGYGDLANFFRFAELPGWPYIDYWAEYPPFFAFLSEIVYRLSGGQEHVFVYFMVGIFTIFQTLNLILFQKLAEKIFPTSPTSAMVRSWLYLALTVGLFYTWGQFDVIVVWAILFALNYFSDGKDLRASIVMGVGILLKWFPILILGMVWRAFHWNRAIRITTIASLLVGILYFGLYLVSPTMTTASMKSQFSKGSWETIWALVDNNYNTGNFGPFIERLNPSTAALHRNNPPTIPSEYTLIPFLLLGAWLFMRSNLVILRKQVGFLGLTWCVFLLWSPGWSPQWVLYLLPLIMLSFPERLSVLLSVLILLLNLLEWPLLLSRGLFWGLWLTIPIRTMLFVFLMILWYKDATKNLDDTVTFHQLEAV